MPKDLLQFFSNNPWLNVLFLFLAIISIILALIFYYKSKKEKLPSYSKRTINIIENNTINSNKLEVKYNSSSITNLSLTELAFWNAGRETIRQSDLIITDPLLIKSTGGVIIYGFEITFKNTANNFVVQTINETCLILSFDFIDLNQGVKLKIYHNGNYSSEIEICGTIVGTTEFRSGIKKGILQNKFYNLYRPIVNIHQNGNSLAKIIVSSFFLFLFPVFITVFLILIPIDIIYEKFNTPNQKEFLLHDE